MEKKVQINVANLLVRMNGVRDATGATANDPHPGGDVLCDYSFEQLDMAQRAAVESHLAVCDDCLETVALADIWKNEEGLENSNFSVDDQDKMVAEALNRLRKVMALSERRRG